MDKTILLAVSGGVDSMTLLHMLLRAKKRVIVAHVDHGIRAVSGEDARFVEGVAKAHGVPFISTELCLGEQASEERARSNRYKWLKERAREYNATLTTAHHQDDVIGSMLINIHRGTEWRGLHVMSDEGISRPLLGWKKAMIYDYAVQHGLEWVEDETNASDRYLRNRLRTATLSLDEQTRGRLLELRSAQAQLRRDIKKQTDICALKAERSRQWYIMTPPNVAREVLREQIASMAGVYLQWPQIDRALHAVKVARAGTTHEVGENVTLRMKQRHFIVEDGAKC